MAQTAASTRAMIKNNPIVLILLFGLPIGFATFNRYGESWDEFQFYKYADSALSSYSAWFTTGSVSITGNTYDNYGPAYVMFVSLGARMLDRLLGWGVSDIRHLLYFFTFLAGVWAFYELAKRWLSTRAAVGATLLFATQPLFWGHAFISPKDIPFLSFFLLSLVFGLRYFDSSEPLSLNGLAPRSKQSLLALTFLWLASVILLILATPFVHAQVSREAFTQFIQIRAGFTLLSTIALILYYRRHAPAVLRSLISILAPAILLGVTICIRILGPLAGLLVGLYASWKQGRRAIPALFAYALFAFAAMYAAWPYLWLNPIGHFIESVEVMAKYPWSGQVLFNGVQYASTDIPRSYLPVLLSVQLTEPVWALFLFGLTATLFEFRKRGEILALTLIWFILPLAGFIVNRTPLYDNFRQVFFILPPVFLMAGMVFEKIKRPVLQAALIVLCVLPGVIDGIRLHPYEYVYYNRFIGGAAGAFRRFELDYWGTSYREAAQWLNANAPERANVWADGPAHLLAMYLRPRIRVYSLYERERARYYDYIVSTSRYNLDLTTDPQGEVVHAIERDGAILTVIKKPSEEFRVSP